MKILHIVAGLEESNGMANTARQFAAEERAQGHDSSVANNLSSLDGSVAAVCLHGAWLPILWRAAKRAKKLGAQLIVRPAGSYDPVRLAYHGWRKRMVSFFERRMLRLADVVLATCPAEVDWIRAYEPCVKKVDVTDLRRFFQIEKGIALPAARLSSPLHVLYLGRRHPLKGVEFLEKAVEGLGVELRIVSDAFGEEKERVWDWCDVLVLPTLSENFGRVVAEALERGKRVVTTDGAPAWGEGLTGLTGFTGLYSGYDGRLIYLKGYRDGSDEKRVALLKKAIGSCYERWR